MSRIASDSDVFHAVADSTRRALLDRLEEGERPATELGGGFSISQPALSRHLRVLRNAGLVSERRVGRQRIYRLEPEPLREVADWVGHYRRFWPRKLRALGEFIEQKR